MSEIQRIAKTFIAYLKRPDLYPELGRKMVKNHSAFENKFIGVFVK